MAEFSEVHAIKRSNNKNGVHCLTNSFGCIFVSPDLKSLAQQEGVLLFRVLYTNSNVSQNL
jgi:hypothetical protein